MAGLTPHDYVVHPGDHTSGEFRRAGVPVGPGMDNTLDMRVSRRWAPDYEASKVDSLKPPKYIYSG